MAGKDILNEYGTSDQSYIRLFEEDQVAFVNDITGLPNSISIRRLLFAFRKKLSTCRLLILGFEDVDVDFLARIGFLHGLTIIRIERNLVDLIASRYEALNQQAQQGIPGHYFTLTSGWFNSLGEWQRCSHRRLHAQQLLRWSFDLWSSDQEYRCRFLASIGLQTDIYPIQTSGEGGGSSFRDNRANSADRLRAVSLQDSFKRFLGEANRSHPELFTKDDRDRIVRFIT
jgi:hypothetical protein